MARLIDADALMEYIENEFDGVCVYDVSGNEAAREFCDMVDIAPTIDAIPMEWLHKEREHCKSTWDIDFYEAVQLVLCEWQKEQEAR